MLSPSLHIQPNSIFTRGNADGVTFTPHTPIVIDLTGDDEEGPPASFRKGMTAFSQTIIDLTHDDSNEDITPQALPIPSCELLDPVSTPKQRVSKAFPKGRIGFIRAPELAVLGYGYPSSPQGLSQQDFQGHSHSSSRAQKSPGPEESSFLSPVDSDATNFPPANQGWVQHFRRRLRDQKENPARHISRRHSRPIQLAKKPITQTVMTARRNSRSTYICVSSQVLEGVDTMRDAIVETGFKCLPRLDSCRADTVQEVKDFEESDKQFQDSFAQVFVYIPSNSKTNDDGVSIERLLHEKAPGPGEDA